jgi:hypothetical protein
MYAAFPPISLVRLARPGRPDDQRDGLGAPDLRQSPSSIPLIRPRARLWTRLWIARWIAAFPGG